MQGASLRQYGVQEGSTVQLLLRLRGGARAGAPGPRSLSKGVRVLSANVTVLRRYADQIFAVQDVDVICMQETRLTAQAQRVLGAVARDRGWDCHWGCPQDSRSGGVWDPPREGRRCWSGRGGRHAARS